MHYFPLKGLFISILGSFINHVDIFLNILDPSPTFVDNFILKTKKVPLPRNGPIWLIFMQFYLLMSWSFPPSCGFLLLVHFWKGNFFVFQPLKPPHPAMSTWFMNAPLTYFGYFSSPSSHFTLCALCNCHLTSSRIHVVYGYPRLPKWKRRRNKGLCRVSAAKIGFIQKLIASFGWNGVLIISKIISHIFWQIGLINQKTGKKQIIGHLAEWSNMKLPHDLIRIWIKGYLLNNKWFISTMNSLKTKKNWMQ